MTNWVAINLACQSGIAVTQFFDGKYYQYVYGNYYIDARWYDLKVDADSTSGELAIYVYDTLIFAYQTSTPYRTGLSGVWSGNAVGYFDNFRLTSDHFPPVAEAGVDQVVFSEVTLDGSGSYDRDSNGSIESYQWNLQHRGDPTNNPSAEGVNPTFSSLAPGFYDVTLTVTDNDGATGTDTMLLAVAEPNPNTDLAVNSFRITKNKRSTRTTTEMLGTINLPELSVSNGGTVHSRITIELFGVLAGGGDSIMSEDAILTVTETPKTLDIRK
jgi:hypothetical protein